MNSDNEAVYRSMGFSAVVDLTTGIIVLVTGIVAGIMLIISAGRLLRNRSRIMI